MQEESIVEEGPKSFTSVLDGLRQSYPKDKMDEISTVSLPFKVPCSNGLIRDLTQSFCFICLLHLANENNLSIKPPKTEEDLAKLAMVPENDDEDVKETISNLMALEILKDRTLL